jgi:hypothetical protein
MIDGHVAFSAAGCIISRKRGNAFQQRRFSGPFSPTIIVMAESNSSSKPFRRKGKQNG